MNDLPRTSGIYMITCTANGKIYIGSATDLHRRCDAHLRKLVRNCHSNPHLQNAWNKHGESAFIFNVVELCNHDEVLEREQHYLDTWQPFSPKGFNISLDAYSVMGGRNHTAQSIEKMKRGQHGKTLEDAHKKKISQSLKGQKKSSTVLSMLSGYSKNMSQDVRDKLASLQSKSYIVTTPEGVEIHVVNLRRFCRENGLVQGAMCAVANGKRTHHHGWGCRHAD